MRDNTSERTLSPTKAGSVYGKLKPSKLGMIVVTDAAGKKKVTSANRKERRHGLLS